jgi:hypothetical protein
MLSWKTAKPVEGHVKGIAADSDGDRHLDLYSRVTGSPGAMRVASKPAGVDS